MKSLVYLVFTGFKNNIKELRHKPGKLILYIVIAAFIIFSMVSTMSPSASFSASINPIWMRGIFFALLMLFYVLSIQVGLTSGNTMFEMSDVNLLFVSPITPQSILIYGLTKLTKSSFLTSIFILFQGTNLSYFGIKGGGLVAMFIFYLLNSISTSILSLVIYSVTNSKPNRKLVVKVIAVAVFIPMICQFLLKFFELKNPIEALQILLDSTSMKIIPFLGWPVAASFGFIDGNIAQALIYTLLIVLSCAIMISYLIFSKADYYEDVLVATETAFEKKRALENSNPQVGMTMNLKTKVTKKGVNGSGSSTFLYKHIRETFRQNRFGFIGFFSLIMCGIFIFISFMAKDSINVVLYLQIIMWIQVFMIGTSRGLSELYLHYIYMIPETPFKKVIWSNLEIVLKSFLESILFFVIPGLIASNNVIHIILCVICYSLFTMFLVGINYLFMKWTSTDISQGLFMFIYLIVVAILLLPGLIPALIIGFTMGGALGTAVALTILSLWELIISLICFGLSKNVLHNTDMPTMKIASGN